MRQVCNPLSHFPSATIPASELHFLVCPPLIAASPPISGLDSSIVIPPRRTHLGAHPWRRGPSVIERALDMLQSLRPRVAEMLSGRQSCIGLECMDVMRLKQDGGVHALFAGDMASTQARRLWSFASASCLLFFSSDSRERACRYGRARVHLVWTHARRAQTAQATLYAPQQCLPPPRPRAGRVPFSCIRRPRVPAVGVDVVAQTTRATRALAPVDVVAQTEVAAADVRSRRPQNMRPVRVDLGTWRLDEVQLCEMGSWGLGDEYVAVGAIDIQMNTHKTRRS